MRAALQFLGFIFGLFQVCIAYAQPGYPIANLFQAVADSNCAPETYTTTYSVCRDPSCGTEIINQQPFDLQVDSGGSDCGLQGQGACDIKISETYGKAVASCNMSCTGNKFKGFDVYHTWTYKGSMGDRANAACRATSCPVESKLPATYQVCRHILHPPDEKAIEAAMQTNRDVDRAAGVLVEVIRRSTISRDALLAISAEAARDTADQAQLAAKFDRIRILIERVGAAVTPAEIAQVASEAGVLNIQRFGKKVNATTLRMRSTDAKFSSINTGRGAPFLTTSAALQQKLGWSPAQATLHLGVDTTTGETKGACVEPPANASPPTSSKNLEFSIRRFDSYQELSRHMFGSASVSAIGYGGAEAEFSRDFKASAESVHLLIDISVTLVRRSSVAERLKTVWADKLSKGGRAAFFQGCGDRYVSAEVKGSRFTAIFTVYAANTEEKEAIKASLSGGVTGSWSVSGGFETAMSKLSRLREVTTKIVSPGYPGGSVPNTAEELTQYAKDFESKVNDGNSTIVDVELLGYETTNNFNSPDPFITRGQLAYLDRADQALLRAHGILANIAFIRNYPDRFDWRGLSNKDVQVAEDVVFEDEQSILAAASACYRSGQNCKTPLPARYFDVIVPKPKAKVMYSGGCSGLNGRFSNYNGGCLDKSTLITWSSIPDRYFDYSEAVMQCRQLNENQTAPGVWSLPSVFEIGGLLDDQGGRSGLSQGNRLADSFWAHDGTANKDPRWVNGANGSSIANPNPKLKFRVLCKQ